jgi:hypothetical protein
MTRPRESDELTPDQGKHGPCRAVKWVGVRSIDLALPWWGWHVTIFHPLEWGLLAIVLILVCVVAAQLFPR